MPAGQKKTVRNFTVIKTMPDAKSKLIDTYEVTGAEVHDSQPTEKLLRENDKGQELYADSAYIGEPIDSMLRGKEIIPQIIERAFKGKPLTEEQKESNHVKSNTLFGRTCLWICY